MGIRLSALRPAILVTVLAVVVATPSTALAGPDPSSPQKSLVNSLDELLKLTPGMTPELLAAMRAQEELNRLTDTIRTLAAKGATASGDVAGMVVEPERNTLRLYWHGTMPAAITAEIGRARSAGITVVVQSAPYTEAELRRETERLVRLPLHSGKPSNQRVMAAMPKPDGSGIKVSIGGLPAGTSTESALRSVPALASEFPLTVDVTSRLAPASRWYDWEPYYGGGYMERTAGGSCSNAFGVTGLNGAATYLLSAAHCGPGEWRTGAVDFGNGPEWNTFGSTIATRDLAHDGHAIHTPLGSDAAVYHGPPVNPNNNDLGATSGIRVGGASRNTIGNLVCTSGSYTGTVCGIRVAATGISYRFEPPEHGVGVMTNMVNAQLPGVSVAGNGDSGGPVYAIRTTDQRAIARGVISAIDLELQEPCTGYVYPGRQCSSSVFYGEVADIMNTIGVRINVS
ncbi:hypothetical protein ACFP2T_43855 [Plantactinospora solaniradicis]|uniref:Streptogrisin C n=1 Tax=Plantactinospora solaniradicis TaxID=1723736 RepID=A0ABW1KNQ0_9ACTN